MIVSRRLALLLLVVLAVPAIALAADTDPKRKINAAADLRAFGKRLAERMKVAGF